MQKQQLYYQIQRYKFESNSQLAWIQTYCLYRCIIKYKDTNLKAIHNFKVKQDAVEKVVLSNTKIQI